MLCKQTKLEILGLFFMIYAAECFSSCRKTMKESLGLKFFPVALEAEGRAPMS